MSAHTCMICSETKELRGAFHPERSLWHTVEIAGYIQPHSGDKVYVIGDEAATQMLQTEAPYYLVTADPFEECEELHMVSIRSFIPMTSLESPGEMACGF